MVVELTGSVGYVLFYINKGSCEQECPQDPNIIIEPFITCDVVMDNPMKIEWRERSSIFPDSRWVIWMKKSIVADELKSFAIIAFILYDKYIRWLKGGESMKTIDLFSQGLERFFFFTERGFIECI